MPKEEQAEWSRIWKGGASANAKGDIDEEWKPVHEKADGSCFWSKDQNPGYLENFGDDIATNVSSRALWWS